MLILAIDTTGEAGGAAIYRDEDCLATIAHEGAGHGYSISLFQMVERLVAEVSRKPHPPLRRLADIELYAAASGPGSFTGIRVGLSAAQAWATAFGRPVRGISVLEALVDASQPATGNALPILDAHRGEFYLGTFQRSGRSLFRPVGDGRVLQPESLKTFIAEQLNGGSDLTCIVRAGDHASASLRFQLPSRIEWRSVEGTLLPAIARIGWREARQGNVDSPSQLNAYYIRRTDAELNWKG
jgi:tRNA threonylcarbamoyladenosine biosynthesis protein TsaB